MGENYLGNPLLKNLIQQLTGRNDGRIPRYEDPVYFAQNHVKSFLLMKCLNSVSPYDFQEKLINNSMRTDSI